jgi:hypothetical protein
VISAVTGRRPLHAGPTGLAYPTRDSNPQPPRSKRGASTNWTSRAWWTGPDSNRLPPVCKTGALPGELQAHGAGDADRTRYPRRTKAVHYPQCFTGTEPTERLELSTSALQERRTTCCASSASLIWVEATSWSSVPAASGSRSSATVGWSAATRLILASERDRPLMGVPQHHAPAAPPGHGPVGWSRTTCLRLPYHADHDGIKRNEPLASAVQERRSDLVSYHPMGPTARLERAPLAYETSARTCRAALAWSR